MGLETTIGDQQAAMAMAAFKHPGIPPTGTVVTFPEVKPAVFVKLPEMGQIEADMGEASFITAKDAENKAGGVK